ncbi:3-hydroxyacyl-CoA dehydrogenase/enoyl-CoA hydratase family protein [Salisaeta longa]|uniref:3-hydroxyacyl-CoA dehydrogenase/enoyl-CoA hydratase family protein n=1 Tax=Salisaeta longa TaxID=503170 RepID=UPI0003B58931|nr:3-hydroxyacyl-CoA dehydrogenase/enoyl-CoA hydratase family protein [Salisaeta longa]
METTAPDTRALALSSPATHPPFRTAAVLGAGTMGAQIAAHLANAGLDVHLLDIAGDDDPNAVVKKGLKQAQNAKPAAFFTDDVADRIYTGNFDDDFARIADADWIIEAVVERMDIKRDVHARIEAHAAADAVISTNTSGLPIHEIAEGRSEDFKQRFLGTHFFNPPRYLKLLELVPTPATDRAVVERVAQFGRLHLGKGIVVANDVPYFIGNRIGVYAQLQAIRYFTEGAYTIEEIDTLTGKLVGHPKSATFRTADVVGLDVLADVTTNLHEKAVDDEKRDAFQVPELLQRLVDEGRLGAKTGAGFYKKENGEIKSIDPKSFTYTGADEQELNLDAIWSAGGVEARLQALYEDDGRAGQFFRETTLDLIGYSARRLGEITDNPADVDRAIRWGFGWELGPFEMWDVLGFETVRDGLAAHDIETPDWVDTMASSGQTAFYKTTESKRHVYVPSDGGYVPDPTPADELTLDPIKAEPSNELWHNDEAALLDIGDGVALFEFRSKANSLGRAVMEGLQEAIAKVEHDPNLRGLVVGNEGKNFSVGANLGEMATAAQQGQFDQIGQYIAGFQETIQRVRYASKPVVVATHQKALGGGCEMAMACPHPVAAAETYIGLVELGVGLIPAGTGTMRMAAWAHQRTPSDHASDIQATLRSYFETIAMAEVAESAPQAIQKGFLPEHTRVVMNADRRLHVAKQEVLRLSEEGYLPPPVQNKVKVLGEKTLAAFKVALRQYREGNYISAYDEFLATKLGYVLTGGDLSAPQEVHEDYLIELEREVFLSLLGEEKTQARVEHILKHNKPLRN